MRRRALTAPRPSGHGQRPALDQSGSLTWPQARRIGRIRPDGCTSPSCLSAAPPTPLYLQPAPSFERASHRRLATRFIDFCCRGRGRHCGGALADAESPRRQSPCPHLLVVPATARRRGGPVGPQTSRWSRANAPSSLVEAAGADDHACARPEPTAARHAHRAHRGRKARSPSERRPLAEQDAPAARRGAGHRAVSWDRPRTRGSSGCARPARGFVTYQAENAYSGHANGGEVDRLARWWAVTHPAHGRRAHRGRQAREPGRRHRAIRRADRFRRRGRGRRCDASAAGPPWAARSVRSASKPSTIALTEPRPRRSQATPRGGGRALR